MIGEPIQRGTDVEHTPTQTGGYSDDQLVDIFTNAKKPDGGSESKPAEKKESTPAPTASESKPKSSPMPPSKSSEKKSR